MKRTFMTANNPMVRVMRSGNYRIPKHGTLFFFCLTLLISAVLHVLGQLVLTLIWGLLSGAGVLHKFNADSIDSMILNLLLTSLEILCALIFVRCIENRSTRTAGTIARGMGRQYLIGMCAGFGTFSGAVLIAWAGGALHYDGIDSPVQWGTLGILLLCWMIQGFSEEICFRGWLMTSLTKHHSPLYGVIVSALVFAAFHLGNDGISVLAFINLTLFGIFAAFYLLRTGSIWGPAAMHGVWNLVQGNFYGIKVSGMELGVTLFRFDSAEGHTLLNGGAFGMEGGLGVTAMMLLGIALLWFTAPREPSAEQA